MKLWTHHPSTFRLDTPGQRIDWTKGVYWQRPLEQTFRYREILPVLHQMLGTDQFLWCCTTRGDYSGINLEEWEIDAPPAEVLRLIRVWEWAALIEGRADTWDKLFLDDLNQEDELENVGVLIRFPVPLEAVTCLGPLKFETVGKPMYIDERGRAKRKQT